MTVLPGPVRQIGYLITDLDRAVNGWLELGNRLRGPKGVLLRNFGYLLGLVAGTQ